MPKSLLDTDTLSAVIKQNPAALSLITRYAILRGLRAKNALLLYTDGLSDAGPSRSELLGTEGLMRLLRRLGAKQDVQTQAESFVAAVSTAIGGSFRDEVAVLLARRQ